AFNSETLKYRQKSPRIASIPGNETDRRLAPGSAGAFRRVGGWGFCAALNPPFGAPRPIAPPKSEFSGFTFILFGILRTRGGGRAEPESPTTSRVFVTSLTIVAIFALRGGNRGIH